MDRSEQDIPMVLVAHLAVRDSGKLQRYASEVQPLMARFGGRIAGFAPAHDSVLEGQWSEGVVVVHHWDSRTAFERFWASAEYQPLKQLRHEACVSDILVFDGLGQRP